MGHYDDCYEASDRKNNELQARCVPMAKTLKAMKAGRFDVNELMFIMQIGVSRFKEGWYEADEKMLKDLINKYGS